MNVVFQRKGNIFEGFWHATKNNFFIGISGIKITPTLVLLSVILLGLVVIMYKITAAPLSGLAIITVGFIAIEVVCYFLATVFSRVYKVNSITLGEDGIIFVDSNIRVEEKISYKNIQKLYYSYRVTMGVAGAFFGRILSLLAFWLQNYVVEYEDVNRKSQKLIIPPDLPNLSELLQTIIKKLELKRIQPNKTSLFIEWRKVSEDGASNPKENYNLSPSVIDPNADIGKLVLVVSIIMITICYLIFRFLM
jgi:hypothetical protein